MKRGSLLFAVVAILAWITGAHAQIGPGSGGTLTVASCGAQTNTVGTPALFTILANGELCTNATGGGGGGGLSVVDGVSFTADTSPFTPSGCEYNSSPTALTSGAQGMVACDQYRAFMVDTPTTNNALYAAITSSMPCQANSGEQTAATTGTPTPIVCDLDGKLINLPYAPRGLWNGGAGSSASTGTTITLLAASGTAGVYEYLTSAQFSNTSATTITVTLNDAKSSIFIIPAGGGSNLVFPIPLKATTANAALTATLSANASTVYGNGQGYNGL